MKKEVVLGLLLIFLTSCTQSSLELPPETKELQEATVGYIGCSNTMQIVNGYLSVGGKNLWDFSEDNIHQYDGGAVISWAENTRNGFWQTFDTYLENNPNTRAVWWQLCMRKEEVSMTYESTLPILQALRERIPGVTVYVSALSEYNPSLCALTGTEGVTRGKELAEELDLKNEDVLLGPLLGPMTQKETDKDGCHLTQEGMQTLGLQLKQFFDNESVETSPEEKTEKNELLKESPSNPRVSAALEPTTCPPIKESKLGESYYKGPLIDTHIHSAAIPDAPIGAKIEDDGMMPVLGVNVRVSDIVCMLDHGNTDKAFVFYPVWEPIIPESIEVVRQIQEKYPDRFIPFIMPPQGDNDREGYPTVDAQTLQKMLSIEPGLFKGYGEIGLYERNDGAAELPPDSNRLTKIYPVVRENNLVVYFHLGEGQKASFEKVLNSNPDINFIWHGDQLISCPDCPDDLSLIDEILSNHPNVYYGIDELYGDVFLIRPEVTKEEFLAHFENKEELLKKDLETWKAFIKRHPDQVLWGTDRGAEVLWSIDPDVSITLAEYARAFIGSLDPAVQEKFAYKNAERLIKATN